MIMSLTKEESQFVEFLESFDKFYMKAHEIAENSKGVSILPVDGGKNEFKMYALDEICHSCSIFRDGNILITPKTTDAIWYKKVGDNFFIFLIEFKGDLLCRNSAKCTLVEVIENLKTVNEDLNDRIEHEVFLLDKVLSKYSDRMLNGLASKPLETVTIALPMIYEEYYDKNRNEIEYLDIRRFLSTSRIIYRVVSISEDYEPNRQRTRSRSYRCSRMIPSSCRRLAGERHDRELDSSYESSLETYHRRYERAGIVYSAGFVDNMAFNNFIEDYLK